MATGYCLSGACWQSPCPSCMECGGRAQRRHRFGRRHGGCPEVVPPAQKGKRRRCRRTPHKSGRHEDARGTPFPYARGVWQRDTASPVRVGNRRARHVWNAVAERSGDTALAGGMAVARRLYPLCKKESGVVAAALHTKADVMKTPGEHAHMPEKNFWAAGRRKTCAPLTTPYHHRPSGLVRNHQQPP